MRRFRLVACFLLILSLSACGTDGGPALVDVSGTVTLDGQPVDGATVTFRPITSEMEAPTSFGRTDAEGRYQLTTAEGKTGALPGRHRVTIVNPQGTEDDTDDSILVFPDPIPVEYREEGKEFTVPDGGTDEADFPITTSQ